MEKIFFIEANRTAIGSPFRGLKNLTAGQLSAAVIDDMFRRSRMKKALVEEVIIGNTVSAGAGQNFARQAVYLAGLPITIPAYTVNNVCGSGLQAVLLAKRALEGGQSGVFLAGGAESASQTPNMISKDEATELKDKAPVDSLIYDGLWCLITGRHMGELCEDLASQHDISREDQDAYALLSHQKACLARDQGAFTKEISPVTMSRGRIFDVDERPRVRISMDSFASLPTAFLEGGTITAGNASVPSDGAALLAMANAKTVKKESLQPMARLVGAVNMAGKPEDVFAAAVPAVEKCLKKCGWSKDSVDIFEITEAFSAQAIYSIRQLGLSPEKVNPLGGDVALGHPLGAAGARSLVTLLHGLKNQGNKRGIAAVCMGGGGAIALGVETCG